MDINYGVYEYNVDNFFSFISYQTNTPFHEIKHKKQIVYIDNYLKKFKDKNIFFVYENEYIDKNYLEDYSSYYVKCFKSYKKTCSRIHFFQTEWEGLDYKKEFKCALEGDKSIINNNNYLGFMIIRPIPHNFLANICIKPYYQQDRFKKYVLLKEYIVSLFGIKLTINTIAFQEQDRILAACATTSLWTFFHAHPEMNLRKVPSSSTITFSAYSESNGNSREFPNKGLSTEMICRGLKKYDFSPEYFEFSHDDLTLEKKEFEILKEYIFSYCSSGIPIILGVSVYEQDETGEKKIESKGLHAVTIVGYSLSNKTNEESKLISHKLEKIYVHDDRFGPFFKIIFNDNKCEVKIERNEKVSSSNNFSEEIYVPNTLILGIYNKIRISYFLIRNTCFDFIDSFSSYLELNAEKHIVDLFNTFTWDIQLKENHMLKEQITKSNISNKEYYLTKPFPKYVWSIGAIYNNISIFNMLFDATDIDSGDVFLDIVPSLDIANNIIELLKVYSNADDIYSSFESSDDNLILSILKHFREEESYKNSLSNLFGYLNIPLRIKMEEYANDAIINQRDMRLNKRSEKALNRCLEEKHTYIWVIDKEGFLCIGIELKDSLKGHPTLTNGMPARIGGELKYNNTKNLWIINPFSGRYSKEYTYEEKNKFVENAITYKFNVYFPTETFAKEIF